MLQNPALKKPKKCLSSYMIFVREERPRIIDDHPDLNVLDVMKEVGRRWQSLGEEDRSYYQSKANEDKIRYFREQEEY